MTAALDQCTPTAPTAQHGRDDTEPIFWVFIPLKDMEQQPAGLLAYDVERRTSPQLVSLHGHGGSMTSWGYETYLFLFVFLSMTDLSDEGCYDLFTIDEDRAKHLTDTISLVITKDSKDIMECTAERECHQKREDMCDVLRCFDEREEEDSAKIKISEKCERGTSQNISMYHFMCLTAKALNFIVEGCEYETVCNLYSERASDPHSHTHKCKTDTLTLTTLLMMSVILNALLPLAVYLYMHHQRRQGWRQENATSPFLSLNGDSPGIQPMTELKQASVNWGVSEISHLMQDEANWDLWHAPHAIDAVESGPPTGIVIQGIPGLLITCCGLYTQRVYVCLDPWNMYRKHIHLPPRLTEGRLSRIHQFGQCFLSTFQLPIQLALTHFKNTWVNSTRKQLQTLGKTFQGTVVTLNLHCVLLNNTFACLREPVRSCQGRHHVCVDRPLALPHPQSKPMH
ncbi:uncharacterized protein LOC122868400 isoform X7 [Siniperca chuatsi]|uniref:uncharacterized protein LOC122868400 isoform X7 n=1 Tax=Siniperca chuatsi TaxID=119488 RepID=UPI001CE0509A|nr:uncharacterized protein LOC122868400 isoform X7 [Siniperca chuatsi]